jgi:hypothetical protein
VKAILAAVADNPRRGSRILSGLAEQLEAPA